MNGMDFYNNVVSNEDLEWIGVPNKANADEVIVKHKPLDAKFALKISAIKEHNWDELHAVLTGQRDPQVMEHITRIVGYYSMLNNWNRSKIAELHDRHKGDYAIQAESPKIEDFLSAGAAQAM